MKHKQLIMFKTALQYDAFVFSLNFIFHNENMLNSACPRVKRNAFSQESFLFCLVFLVLLLYTQLLHIQKEFKQAYLHPCQHRIHLYCSGFIFYLPDLVSLTKPVADTKILTEIKIFIKYKNKIQLKNTDTSLKESL